MFHKLLKAVTATNGMFGRRRSIRQRTQTIVYDGAHSCTPESTVRRSEDAIGGSIEDSPVESHFQCTMQATPINTPPLAVAKPLTDVSQSAILSAAIDRLLCALFSNSSAFQKARHIQYFVKRLAAIKMHDRRPNKRSVKPRLPNTATPKRVTFAPTAAAKMKETAAEGRAATIVHIPGFKESPPSNLQPRPSACSAISQSYHSEHLNCTGKQPIVIKNRSIAFQAALQRFQAYEQKELYNR